MSLQVLKYQRNAIAFDFGTDSTMINATQMAQAFGKRASDWLKTQQAQNYINAYSKATKIVLTELQNVRNGGSDNGTWFHEDIALEFARWLSPEFSIWCNLQIKRQLKQANSMFAIPRNTLAGIETIIIGEKTLVPYAVFLKSIGIKSGGSAYERRAIYPDQFLKVSGTLYISIELAELIHANRMIFNKRKAVKKLEPILPRDFGKPIKATKSFPLNLFSGFNSKAIL